jgi:hypothetical protein
MSDFARLLFNASSEALRGRSLQIFNARFGYVKGHQLKSSEQIGETFGISRLRVRQSLSKALTRIRWKGTRQLRRGEQGACAKLLFHLCALIGPVMTPDAVLAVCRELQYGDDWSLAYLLVNLVMTGTDHRRNLLAQIKSLIEAEAASVFPLPQVPVCVTI